MAEPIVEEAAEHENGGTTTMNKDLEEVDKEGEPEET